MSVWRPVRRFQFCCNTAFALLACDTPFGSDSKTSFGSGPPCGSRLRHVLPAREAKSWRGGTFGSSRSSGEKRDRLGPASRSGVRCTFDPSRVLSPAPGKPEADRCRSLLPLMPEGQAPDIARRATYQWRARSDVHRAMGSDPPVPRSPPRAITVMTELSCERDEGENKPGPGGRG